MNVLHLSTYDTHGGAAVAALRLAQSQRRRGHEATVLVRDRLTTAPGVVAAFESAAHPHTERTLATFAWQVTRHCRAAHADTSFSSDLPTYRIDEHPLVRRADVLHLHWVAGFLSSYAIGRLQALGKPVVWTLHDQFPFTGGCHFAFGCRRYRRDCTGCPQLLRDVRALASLTLAQKRQHIDSPRIVVACPSAWLARAARSSALFSGAPIRIVPYGLDVDEHQSTDRLSARTALGLPPDAIILFVCSANHRESRKGDRHVTDALIHIHARRRLRDPAIARRFLVLTAGEGGSDVSVAGFARRGLGLLAPEAPELHMAYRAADLFVLPSLEDNLPNTLLEAMASGLAVAAYRTGGVPDLISHESTGLLVRRGQPEALGDAIARLVNDQALREQLGGNALRRARERLDWPLQVDAYNALYAEARTLVGKPRRAGRKHQTKMATFERDPLADAPLLRRMLADGGTTRAVARLVVAENEALQDVIAARGGEIRDLRRAISMKEAEIAHLRRVAHVAADRPGIGLSQPPQASALTVGIFGTGSGGRRVWEGVLVHESCRVAWFADNDSMKHGSTLLGCPVISPDAIARTPVDLVVIASVHRDPIMRQLLDLGVSTERIAAPDLSVSDLDLVAEISRLVYATTAARKAGQ